MSLTLYMHPLSSFCHKVLIALYEKAIPFEPQVVDLGNPAAREEFKQVWPFATFPVLRDLAHMRTIPESTVIIEYLEQRYPGAVKLIPEDPQLALQVRAADRFYDLHVHIPMQKVVGDRLRPADGHDPIGVAQAKEHILTALRLVESDMAARRWAAGDRFSMADCAAAPPLFYISVMMPLSKTFPNVSAYLGRLMEHPSHARTLAEAQPYIANFPGRGALE